MTAQPSVVVLDADNTLYDWIAYFAGSLRSAAFELRTWAGGTMPAILDDLRSIYRRHGTVEYGFYLQELPELSPLRGHNRVVMEHVIETFRRRRAETLVPYPGVQDGLTAMRSAGIRVVVVSDASQFHLLSRLDELALLGDIEAVYCAADYTVQAGSERLRQGASQTFFAVTPMSR